MSGDAISDEAANGERPDTSTVAATAADSIAAEARDRDDIPPTRLTVDALAIKGFSRASARLVDRLRRAENRRVGMLESLATSVTETGSSFQICSEETIMTNNELPAVQDAIAASRRRINAGISALDRALSEQPVRTIETLGNPEALLDALAVSAVATVSVDLAAVARGLSTNLASPVEITPVPAVIDGRELIGAPQPPNQ